MQGQSQNPYNNSACVRYLILLNSSIRFIQPIALYQDKIKIAMLKKLTLVKCALVSATLVGCGGGIGEKNSIGLNTTNTSGTTNNENNSNTDESNSANNNQSNTVNNNSSDSQSELEASTNKTFSADNAQYNWRAIGENIAAGQPTADVAVQEWLESAGHCENIMSASFQEIGAACVTDNGAQYTHYWTQVFGTRF